MTAGVVSSDFATDALTLMSGDADSQGASISRVNSG
jgi:hypothetical protein